MRRFNCLEHASEAAGQPANDHGSQVHHPATALSVLTVALGRYHRPDGTRPGDYARPELTCAFTGAKALQRYHYSLLRLAGLQGNAARSCQKMTRRHCPPERGQGKCVNGGALHYRCTTEEKLKRGKLSKPLIIWWAILGLNQ
jgi:hypothetical protein